ncbi:stage IV sporulation protein FA [Pelagirhabdus alkalitolerans]|uniref:Stage IV sporulation protein FA n=2 Tax=Pelagirhabdus alkalitolerans TaxID=1612202 RepID=A0A1G6HP31_9BACI|nr:stage IV sporulation protein FA [Pelagirhabdus alkalitolerans]
MDKQTKKIMRQIKRRKQPTVKNTEPIRAQSTDPDKRSKLNGYIQVFVASLFLIVSVFLIQSSHASLSVPKQWLNRQMTEAFPFATVHLWYTETVGLPFSISDQKNIEHDSLAVSLPVSTYQNKGLIASGEGLIIETNDRDLDIYSVKAGTVLFVGKQTPFEQTVIIQHADRSQTTYGLLDEVDVLPFQFVEAGEKIAKVDATINRLYLSMQKEDQFLDPTEVIDVWK